MLSIFLNQSSVFIISLTILQNDRKTYLAYIF